MSHCQRIKEQMLVLDIKPIVQFYMHSQLLFDNALVLNWLGPVSLTG